MTVPPRNDDRATSAHLASSDSTGPAQAALLLVESLIHALIARSIITTVEAIEVVETALDADEELKAEATSPHSRLNLDAVLQSLNADVRASPANVSLPD